MRFDDILFYSIRLCLRVSCSVHVGTVAVGCQWHCWWQHPHWLSFQRIHACDDPGRYAVRLAAPHISRWRRGTVRSGLFGRCSRNGCAALALRLLVHDGGFPRAGGYGRHVQFMWSDVAESLLPRGAAVLRDERLPPAAEPAGGDRHAPHGQGE